MKQGIFSSLTKAPIACLYFVCALILGACGGSTQTAGVGGTGITVGKGYVQGRVTGFGSVFVNGVEFDTDASSFIVDGNASASQADLAVGMIVTLEVETEDGSYNGKALKVVYDDEIEGPIASVTSNVTELTIEVFGQSIVVSDTSTLFKNTGFADLRDNGVDYVVEVSGFRVSPTEINATYIEKKGVLMLGVTEVELRGNINNLSSGPAPSFELDGVSITTNVATEIDVPGGTLSENLYVEVKGVIQTPTSVLASEIEYEDEDFGDDADDVRLQGVITDYVDIDSIFRINGQQVDASRARLEPANAAMLLGNGVEVEVEGDIVGGVLQAQELEIEEGSAELRALVGSVNPSSNEFTVSYPTTPAGSVIVSVGTQTVLEDEAGASPLPVLTLSDIDPGDYVRVEGREEGGKVVASTVKRTDADDSLKLTGIVQAYSADISITILGVQYQLVDGTTSYSPNKNFSTGDIVQVEDGDSSTAADGIADSLELED